MGEAKRRKLLDPDYGKPKTDVLPTYDKSNTNLLADYGDYLVRTGCEEMNLFVKNVLVFAAENDSYISFASEQYCGTILTTPSIAKSYQNRPFIGKVKPSPQERYRTEITKEWVTPLRIIETP